MTRSQIIGNGYSVWVDASVPRALACVDACAGLNPEAIPALVKAARSAVEMLEGAGYSMGDVEKWSESARVASETAILAEAKALNAALAAVRGEK